jgi:hypothetical protein
MVDLVTQSSRKSIEIFVTLDYHRFRSDLEILLSFTSKYFSTLSIYQLPEVGVIVVVDKVFLSNQNKVVLHFEHISAILHESRP